jgi:hypothetical protein
LEASPRQISPKEIVQQQQQNPNTNRAGGVAQVVEQLPSKCEALSTNSSSTKKKKKKEGIEKTLDIRH